MRGYFELIQRHGRVLAFGFLLTFLSSFGQTFFISLFNTDVRTAFGLSHGAFGTLYSVATLCSGLLMIWAGGVVDRIPVARYGAIALAGLALSAALFAWAPHWSLLALSIFGLRLFGQGMASHAAITSMARRFDRERGKAIGIASLGFSVSEAVMPTVAVALALAIGRTWTWTAAALLLLAILALRPGRLIEGGARVAASAGPDTGTDGRDSTRGEMLRDPRFYLFVPSLLAPAAIGTGFFFHQLLLADSQGWPVSVLALSIGAYAAAGLAASLLTGGLVDRFRAVRLTRFHLLPLAAAGGVLAMLDGAWTAPVFFGLLGMTAGANSIVVPAMWAELYGVRHLGAIRAVGGAIMVVATAITPGTMGLLVDSGIGIDAIAVGCSVYALAATALNTRIRPGRRPSHRAEGTAPKSCQSQT